MVVLITKIKNIITKKIKTWTQGGAGPHLGPSLAEDIQTQMKESRGASQFLANYIQTLFGDGTEPHSCIRIFKKKK